MTNEETLPNTGIANQADVTAQSKEETAPAVSPNKTEADLTAQGKGTIDEAPSGGKGAASMPSKEDDERNQGTVRLAEEQTKFISWKKAEEEKLVSEHLFLQREAADLDSRKKDLDSRANKILDDERKMTEGFAAEKEKQLSDLRREISEQRAKMHDAWEEEKKTLFAKEMERIKNMEDALAAQKEKNAAECAALKTALEAECISVKKEAEEQSALQKETLENDYRSKSEALAAEYAQKRYALDEEQAQVETEKKKLALRLDNCGRLEKNIDSEVERRTDERYKECQRREQVAKDECERLRGEIQGQDELIAAFEDVKRRLGGRDAEQVIAELTAREEHITALQKELNSRPTADIRNKYDELNGMLKDRDAEIARLNGLVIELQEKSSETDRAYAGQEKYMQERDAAMAAKDAMEAQANLNMAELAKLREETERLKNTYEAEQGRAERERYIMQLCYKEEEFPRRDKPENEVDYLNGIADGIKGLGFAFPRRLLNAFHTSLKTADMSIMTVLSGVSGTGKSELPKLYSRFGGINFISVPVEPNWDSKESMLGFFNTINNKFDAQELLKFLVQAQRDSGDNGGLNDALNMVLLDEMNLAYVELYFADFLSKLEERRDGSTPFIPLKVGSGMPDVRLNLHRNVLWVGTMNQDETTKALSDKVLDRGIVINFPRPATFKGRKKAEKKDADLRYPLLRWDDWNEWIAKEYLSSDVIGDYKEKAEEINRSLAKVGRSLGHRVWQSIECYMANHPLVMYAEDDDAKKRATKTAFEDCLVQKVMPKLRGIDTADDSGKQCLDEIQKILVEGHYGIVQDFSNAMEHGGGQFMWSSSDYLNADEGN